MTAPGGTPDDELPPGTRLPPAALPAWRAYRAMRASKASHFAALAAADSARRERGAPPLAAAAQRARLRDGHDAAVRGFAAAMQTLAAPVAAAPRGLL
ncbi:MAG: hypothetical protein RLW61_05450, partial [Gammaproteobacteria bacterium]